MQVHINMKVTARNMEEQMQDSKKLKYKPTKIYNNIESVNLEELKSRGYTGDFFGCR